MSDISELKSERSSHCVSSESLKITARLHIGIFLYYRAPTLLREFVMRTLHRHINLIKAVFKIL